MKRIGAFLLTFPIVFAFSVSTGWSQAIVQIIPQIAAGSFDSGLSKYSTVMEIVNPNSTSVTVSGNFFKEDGSASNLNYTTNLPSVPTFSNGTLNTVTLDPGKVLVISTGTTAATTPATGTLAWARITTNGDVSIATFFDYRAQSNALLARVGVQTSPSTMARFLIPRVRNVATGQDTGFAVVNTSVISATLTVTLRDAAGATIAMRNLTMTGNSHRSLFAREFFELTNEPSGTNYQYINFEAGNAAQFAAIALAFEGAIPTSFPVDQLR